MAEGVIEIIIGGASSTGGSSGSIESANNGAENQIEETFNSAVNKLMHPMRSAKSGVVDAVGNLLGSKAARATTGVFTLVGNAAALALKLARTDLNRAFALKENYLAQNHMAAFSAEMDAAKSLATSLLSGAAVGFTTGGPLGAIIGGISGAATSAINLQLQKGETIERYNMQLNATNAQTEFSASRAALVNGSRGTEY